jgi:hypothetical protein
MVSAAQAANCRESQHPVFIMRPLRISPGRVPLRHLEFADLLTGLFWFVAMIVPKKRQIDIPRNIVLVLMCF